MVRIRRSGRAGGRERERGDAIGDSARFFARSEVRCIILLEWIIHTRHLHGMRKSRSFINSSPSQGDPRFALPSQRPTPSFTRPPGGRKRKKKKERRERNEGRGEEKLVRDNALFSHLVNARCAKNSPSRSHRGRGGGPRPPEFDPPLPPRLLGFFMGF